MTISNSGTTHKINSVAVIGNYLPRQCGIATFTTDLVQSLSAQGYRCRALAVNDRPEGYDYPDEVRFEINQDQLSHYHTAAKFLNTNEVDIVSLQHEFGIFGGKSGDYILTLLERLKMPIVTTLHTVLTEPTTKQLKIIKRLTNLSDRFVVMSKNAISILETLYDVPREKITFIPHGIPDMPFVDPNYYKDQFDLLGQKVLLTFGLLSQNKGIEYVIKGLPGVVDRFPELTYIVLGSTHPHVLETEGQKYRKYLQRLVQDLGLEDHVRFINEFVPFDKLCDYLSATDLYITPYVDEQQITSGTLAYAAGTGKAIISTPYWYAKEMLADGRGRLIPFKDEEAMGEAIVEVFENDAVRHQMRKRSYDFNRNATWKEVALQYMETFQDVKLNRARCPRPHNASHPDCYYAKNDKKNLPRLKINHLLIQTDDTGLLQHATFTVPNRNHGYCTDDNARALIVAIQAQELSQLSEEDLLQLDMLVNRYLSFILHAYNPENGRFRNCMSYSRQWLESAGSEDSHGRALWGLGVAVALAKQRSNLSLASTLFMRALKITESFQSPRAIAFTMLGIDAYLKTFSGDSKARRIYSVLAEKLFSQFDAHATPDWPWLEDIVAYSNGKLPHALIMAGDTLQRKDIKQMGLRALNWLFETQSENGHLTPIGNQGWHVRDIHKARFDQQPLEANTLLEASIAAYKTEGSKHWLGRAEVCFSWFLGNNDLNLSIYDYETGGCRDGLQVDNVNQNEGAESTLAWLLSLIAMYQLAEEDVSLSSKRIKHMKINN
ncbi:glycosyltransferase family 4 protein [Fodinibius sp.]|uniref:glycosyltransferase family 4 protein n=1 Tax=Fodinibius sp. TaxID=1872440 RepID=UPI0035644E9E